MALTLRPYQREAVDALYGYWSEGGGNGLIVLPTGAGKSLVIATLCYELLLQYPTLRICVATHVKELIAQNMQELFRVWPGAPAGIYSAGLGRRDAHSRILFAGIQSIHKIDVGDIDLLMVDEAHLIPRNADTQYGRFIAACRARVPDMRLVGLTATPLRLDSGRLDKGKDRLFDDVIYDANVRDLIDGGYLSSLVGKATAAEIDTSDVHVRGGEFVAGELQAAASRPAVIVSAVREIIAAGRDRAGWLAFCTGVEHAGLVADEIRAHGVSCETITGDTPAAERDSIIARYKARKIKCLTSVGVLTTGFNAPHVDLIAMLRPTLSTGLYVQMIGRGFRLAEGKENCLVLDFAGNIRRHGPVDAPTPKRDPGGGDVEKIKPNDVRAKVCPVCQAYAHPAVRRCATCDYVWPEAEVLHAAEAEAVAVLSTEAERWIDVRSVVFSRHEKEGAPPSLRVEYRAGIKTYREWLCFEHSGFPRDKAGMIWRRLDGVKPAPSTVEEALTRIGELSPITGIQVRAGGPYPEVVSRRIGSKMAEAAE